MAQLTREFTTECGCNRYPCDCTGCDCDGTFHDPGPDCPGQDGRAWAAEAAVEAWNAANPVGVPVRFWTGLRTGEGAESVTRSKASVLGGHTAVVWVEGEGSCIALTHVMRIGGDA